MSNDNQDDTKKQQDAIRDIFAGLFGPKLTNMPPDMEAAVKRIQELELVLEDLARAVEIASVTQSWTLLEGFVTRANEALEKKMLNDWKGPEIVMVGPGEDVTINVGVDKDGNLGTEVRRS